MADDNFRRLQFGIAQNRMRQHADEIKELFVDGAKITILVRQPSYPDGSRDFVLTDDTLKEAIEALTIREAADG